MRYTWLLVCIYLMIGPVLAQDDVDCEELVAEVLVEANLFDNVDEVFDEWDQMNDEDLDEFFDEFGLFDILDACESGEITQVDDVDLDALLGNESDGDSMMDGDGDDDLPSRIELVNERVYTVDQMVSAGAEISENAQGFMEAYFSDYDMTLIEVPAGTFIMGADDLNTFEGPSHEVTLDTYWIQKNMVTNAQFADFVEATGYVTDAEQPGAEGCFVYNPASLEFEPTAGRYWRNAFETLRDDHPVVCVSRNDAEAYASWLSEQIGLPLALPTEAQWEKAARGTDGRLYPWGDVAPDGTRANYADASFNEKYPGALQGNPDLSVNDGYADTSPVGSYPAGVSPYGVYDMAGNASEWVADALGLYEGPVTNPYTPPSNFESINRGGSWVEASGFPPLTESEIEEGHIIRSAHRAGGDPPVSSDDHLGFRLVLDGLVRNP